MQHRLTQLARILLAILLLAQSIQPAAAMAIVGMHCLKPSSTSQACSVTTVQLASPLKPLTAAVMPCCACCRQMRMTMPSDGFSTWISSSNCRLTVQYLSIERVPGTSDGRSTAFASQVTSVCPPNIAPALSTQSIFTQRVDAHVIVSLRGNSHGLRAPPIS
jgi:hypothetical protein